jgi:hypothetical protein
MSSQGADEVSDSRDIAWVSLPQSYEETEPMEIDLNDQSQGPLNKLPTELFHRICEYLFPTHNPNYVIMEPNDPSFVDPYKTPRCSHPLDYLAATGKDFRYKINGWASHKARQYRNIADLEHNRLRSLRSNILLGHNLLRHKSAGLLTWSETCCVFCGEETLRSAVFMNGLRCCKDCDDQQWTKFDPETDLYVPFHKLQPPLILTDREHIYLTIVPKMRRAWVRKDGGIHVVYGIAPIKRALRVHTRPRGVQSLEAIRNRFIFLQSQIRVLDSRREIADRILNGELARQNLRPPPGVINTILTRHSRRIILISRDKSQILVTLRSMLSDARIRRSPHLGSCNTDACMFGDDEECDVYRNAVQAR